MRFITENRNDPRRRMGTPTDNREKYLIRLHISAKSFLPILAFLSSVFCLLSSGSYAAAEKITILYTGETHSMLYPCDCPLGTDGGLSKRSTEIKKARKDNANVLLVDSGGMFAGGQLDEYTQTTELDKKRTLLNLEAVKLMGYDAVALGDDEFNFGEDFFKSALREKGVTFLSSNLENDYVQGFLIKQVGGVKVGILALTNSAAKDKIENIKYIDPEEALKKDIKELRLKGAEVILVLSHLGEEGDLNLINRIKGIDILVCGHRLTHNPSLPNKIADTIILRPVWQGRKLGRADLEIENGKVINYAINDVLIDKKTVEDDPQISALLPECFCGKECRKAGFLGTCENPATNSAKCVFAQPEAVSVLIIKPRVCITCDMDKSFAYLKNNFLNIKVSYLNYETKQAQNLVKRLGIQMLPAYLFGKEVEKNKNFNKLSRYLRLKEGRYLLDPALLGVSYFVGREKKKGTLDLFLSLFDKNSEGFLNLMKDLSAEREKLNFRLHFLAIHDKEEITAPYGLAELEEDTRSVCVMNKYPDKWRDYLSCRAKNIQSTWWNECMDSCGIDINLINQCNKSQEGRNLLLENTALSSDLKISASGTFLLDNQEVFSAVKVPTKEELERIIK